MDTTPLSLLHKIIIFHTNFNLFHWKAHYPHRYNPNVTNSSLSTILQHWSITQISLKLKNVDISSNVLQSIAKGISKNVTLQNLSIDLEKEHFFPLFLKGIQGCRQLVDINLYSETCFYMDAEQMAAIIMQNPIECLKCRSCEIKNDTSCIQKAITENHTIKVFEYYPPINVLFDPNGKENSLKMLRGFHHHDTIEELSFDESIYDTLSYHDLKNLLNSAPNLKTFMVSLDWLSEQITEIIKVLEKKENIEKLLVFCTFIKSREKIYDLFSKCTVNYHLKSIEFSDIKFYPSIEQMHQVTSLCKLLAKNMSLESVTIPHSEVRLIKLFQTLTTTSSITKFNLTEYNPFQREEQLEIAKFLGFKTLQTFIYNFFELKRWAAESVNSFVYSIATHQHLQVLKLTRLKGIEYESIVPIGEIFQQNHVIHTLEIIGDVMPPSCYDILFKAVKVNHGLRNLLIETTLTDKIEPETIDVIVDALKTNKTLNNMVITLQDLNSEILANALGLNLVNLKILARFPTIEAIQEFTNSLSKNHRARSVELNVEYGIALDEIFPPFAQYFLTNLETRRSLEIFKVYAKSDYDGDELEPLLQALKKNKNAQKLCITCDNPQPYLPLLKGLMCEVKFKPVVKEGMTKKLSSMLLS